MTGPTLAAILIPPAGTICLLAWLALVFYAGRDHPRRPDSTRRPAAQAPARPRRLPGATQTPAQPIGARGADSGPRSGNTTGWPVPDQERRSPPPRPPEPSPPRSEEETMHPELPELSRSAK